MHLPKKYCQHWLRDKSLLRDMDFNVNEQSAIKPRKRKREKEVLISKSGQEIDVEKLILEAQLKTLQNVGIEMTCGLLFVSVCCEL